MITDPPGTPAGDLHGTIQGAIADLAEMARWLPGMTARDARRAAVILDRLAEELAEAAAMTRALPARPPGQAGHTVAAAAALATAARREPDFARWLTTVLRGTAREPDTALTARPPDSWDAWLVRQLVAGPPLGTPPPGTQTAAAAS